MPFLQNYDTTESKLRREFEVYGPIKRVGLFTFVPPTSSYRFTKFCLSAVSQQKFNLF